MNKRKNNNKEYRLDYLMQKNETNEQRREKKENKT